MNLPPLSARDLHRLLALRLSPAVLIIGLAMGGVAYWLEERHIEQAALERAAEGAQHFESPAARLAIDKNSMQNHQELAILLDRRRFIGVRIFGADKHPVYETWADVPRSLIEAAQSQQHVWPPLGASHRNWSAIAGQQLIQVVVPLAGPDGALAGYLESVTRLDEKTLQAQRHDVRNAALMASASVALTALLLYPLLLGMLRAAAALSHRLLDANLSLLHALGAAVAKRDSDTDAHNYRVTCYAVALAEALQAPKAVISELVSGAFLHDVGKIGVPDSILLKPGRLTADEFEIMKRHVLLGIDIVAGNRWLEGAAQVIRHHHERFDGTGYPDGLQGKDIPLTARIFAVADVFDALTSERPYKKPMPQAEALSVIEQGAGSHFDPEMTTVFVQIAPALHAELRNASAQTLLRRMQEILARYFSVGAAAGDQRERQQSVMKLKYACDQHAPTIKSSPDAPQGA